VTQIGIVIGGIIIFLAFCAFADSVTDKDHDDED
jgi:hypothetical protein